jgi:hypothetical protein
VYQVKKDLIDAFARASVYTQYEDVLSDASYNLYRFWANVEARDLNDLPSAFSRYKPYLTSCNRFEAFLFSPSSLTILILMHLQMGEFGEKGRQG